MEAKIIDAVLRHPELYNSTMYLYRDRLHKLRAWERVSRELDLPLESVRKKWKNLRDTYLKEKRKDLKDVEFRRSSSAAPTVKKWKYYDLLGFLDPFVNSKEISGLIGPESPQTEAATAEAALKAANGDFAADTEALLVSDVKPFPKRVSRTPDVGKDWSVETEAPPIIAAAAAHDSGPGRPRTLKRRRETLSSTLSSTLSQTPSQHCSGLSEDGHFLMSLVPSLEKMSPERKEHVKFQIHKLVFKNLNVCKK